MRGYDVIESPGVLIKAWTRGVPIEDAALAQLAKMLVAAENPVILCDRMARTPAGMPRLVELAETLQCAVIDNYGRMNFPSRHPLNQSFRRSILSQADLILAMEVNDIWGSLSDFHDRIVRSSEPRYKKTAKIVTLGTRGLYMKANYQDFGRYQEVDLDISGDAEASLPVLTEQVKRLVDEISARPAAARAIALKDKHTFKAEMDDAARDIMFGHLKNKVA